MAGGQISSRKRGSLTSYTSQNPWTILGSSGQTDLSIEKCLSGIFGVHVLPQQPQNNKDAAVNMRRHHFVYNMHWRCCRLVFSGVCGGPFCFVAEPPTSAWIWGSIPIAERKQNIAQDINLHTHLEVMKGPMLQRKETGNKNNFIIHTHLP